MYRHMFFRYLTHPEYLICCWSIMSESTLMINSNYFYFRIWPCQNNTSGHYVNIYMRFCAHLKCNSLKIYRSRNCFEYNFHRKLNTFYAQYIFFDIFRDS
jgi:hypothetical protein